MTIEAGAGGFGVEMVTFRGDLDDVGDRGVW